MEVGFGGGLTTGFCGLGERGFGAVYGFVLRRENKRYKKVVEFEKICVFGFLHACNV